MLPGIISGILNGDLKIQRRPRQRERLLKSKFAFFQSLSRLFLPAYFVKCRRTVLDEGEFQGTISNFRKRNKMSPLLVYVLR